MNDTSTLLPQLQVKFRSRSMGMKLIVVCGLALVMIIPALFVGGLVEERTRRAANVTREISSHVGGQQTFLGPTLAIPYTVSSQTTGGRPEHGIYLIFPVEGGATVKTRTEERRRSLLSFAERIGFDLGFLIAGSATVILLSANAGWIFESRIQGFRALLCFGLLYALIYMLLRLEDNALFIGAIASFLTVAAAMYFTRRIDWYSQLGVSGAQEQQNTLLVPKDPA